MKSARICIGAIVALAFSIMATAPSRAATFDLDDLGSPVPPVSTQDLPATDLTGTLDKTTRQKLASALLLIEAEDFSGAATAAREVTASRPDAPEGWYVLGVVLSNLGETDEALAALDRAASLYTANAEPLVVKGDILLSLDRRDEAEQAWVAAADRDPANWRAQERLAAMAEARGDRTEALARFENANANGSPDRIYPRLQAARLSLVMGNAKRAEELLAADAEKPDAEDKVLDYLARAKVGLDKLDEATALYDQLILRGTSVRAFISRSKLYVTAGDLPAAGSLLEQAAVAFPDEPLVALEQGNLLGATGQYEDALARFEAGLALAPDNPALLRSASLSAVRLDRTALALDYAVKLAGPTATDKDFVWLATLQESAGDVTGAVASYALALEKNGKNWVALNNLAVLRTSDDPSAAVTLAEQAAALAPDVPAVRDTLAWAAFKAGDAERAGAIYGDLLETDATNATYLYRSGLVQIARGDDARGKELVAAALAADPTFKFAAEASTLLEGN